MFGSVVGSTQPLTAPMYILNETSRIVEREITYTPGLFKIYDEIVVNAADNKQRDPNMDRLDIIVDADKNHISVRNNGKGIPIVMHKEHNVYVPSMIFGQLLTGSNFDDDEAKTTGGRVRSSSERFVAFALLPALTCLARLSRMDMVRN
jgi:DNA topoisomerase II